MEKNNEIIIRDLKEKGYRNKSINYEEFLEIYEPYKKEMTEKEFAGILGISIYSFKNMKSGRINAKILKEEIKEERKEEIRDTLRVQGYRNKLINYQEFLEIYEPYKEEMTEKEFAEILRVSYAKLHKVKYKGTKTRMLKDDKEIVKKIEKERREEIREELKDQGYRNKSINYQEFLEIYKSYRKEMTEKEFAKILGISEVNLRNIKYVGIKTKVLKEDTGITEEKKEEIRAELKGQGYERKSINYQEFLEIYEPYRKEMTERKFAEILGISSLGNIKYGGMRAKILKEKVEKEEKIKEERKEEIREELKEQGYERKSIDYQEFLEIYELYRKELTRQEFVEVLGISYNNIYRMKNRGTKVKILRRKIEIEEERKEEIRNELKGKGYRNKIINYQGFLEIYELYRNEMTQRELAEILGFSYNHLYTIKNKGAKVKILKEKIEEERKDEIRAELKGQGYRNKLINYQEFLGIYEPYREEMTEQEFAEILEVSYANFYAVKHNGTKAKVLKEEKSETEELSEVKEELEERTEEDVEKIVQDMGRCYQKQMKAKEAIDYIIENYGISKEDLLGILNEEVSKKNTKEEEDLGEEFGEIC